MAEVVLTNAFVSIDGNDMSDHVRSVTFDYGAEPQDITAMSDTTRQRTGGLLDWSVSVEFNQDYAASDVDSILFPLIGTTVTIILRPTASAVSTTNPNFTGTALVESYNPLGAGVGDVLTTTCQLSAAGALSRATS